MKHFVWIMSITFWYLIIILEDHSRINIKLIKGLVLNVSRIPLSVATCSLFCYERKSYQDSLSNRGI